MSFPLTFCDNERFGKDGELHLGSRNFSHSNSREISGSLVQVRARVVNYLSGVIGPLLYINWICQIRYLNALWPVEVRRVSCSHASVTSHSRTAQIVGGFFCWPSSIGTHSMASLQLAAYPRTFSLFHALVYGV